MRPRRGGLYTRMKIPRHRRFTLSSKLLDIEIPIDNINMFLENEYTVVTRDPNMVLWAVGGFRHD